MGFGGLEGVGGLGRLGGGWRLGRLGEVGGLGRLGDGEVGGGWGIGEVGGLGRLEVGGLGTWWGQRRTISGQPFWSLPIVSGLPDYFCLFTPRPSSHLARRFLAILGGSQTISGHWPLRRLPDHFCPFRQLNNTKNKFIS